MSVDGRELKRNAVGRWPAILRQLGVDEKFLNPKHGPCPVCGGVDRFRFDDKEGRGTYYCSQCEPHAGGGMNLVMSVFGVTYPTALEMVAGVLGTAEPVTPSAESKMDPMAALLRLERGISQERGPVAEYLAKRGLNSVPPVLCWHPSCVYTEPGKETIRVPAMLAPVQSPRGENPVISYHRTYLSTDWRVRVRKKLMPATQPLEGAAIRLYPLRSTLVVAEGIETAIACREMWRLSAWSLISTSVMRSWVPPNGVERVIIAGDNDAKLGGQAAAYALGHRLATKYGLDVEVRIPDGPGQDWLDVWNQQQGMCDGMCDARTVS